MQFRMYYFGTFYLIYLRPYMKHGLLFTKHLKLPHSHNFIYKWPYHQ